VDPSGLLEQPNYNQTIELSYPNKVEPKQSLASRIGEDIKKAISGFCDADLPMKRIGKDIIKAIKGGAGGLNKLQNLDLNKNPAAAPFINIINTSKYTADMAVRGQNKIIDTVKHFNPTLILPNADMAINTAEEKYAQCIAKCSSDSNSSK